MAGDQFLDIPSDEQHNHGYFKHDWTRRGSQSRRVPHLIHCSERSRDPAGGSAAIVPALYFLTWEETLSAFALLQSLTIHAQTYNGSLRIVVMAAEDYISDPQGLIGNFQEAYLELVDAASSA